MMITGKTYDALKWCAQILFPAVGTLYFSIAQIWGLPAAEEVVGTIVVIDTFLGVLLGISQSHFQEQTAKGTIDTFQSVTGELKYTLNLDDDPSTLRHKKRAVFDVVRS